MARTKRTKSRATDAAVARKLAAGSTFGKARRVSEDPRVNAHGNVLRTIPLDRKDAIEVIQIWQADRDEPRSLVINSIVTQPMGHTSSGKSYPKWMDDVMIKADSVFETGADGSVVLRRPVSSPIALDPRVHVLEHSIRASPDNMRAARAIFSSWAADIGEHRPLIIETSGPISLKEPILYREWVDELKAHSWLVVIDRGGSVTIWRAAARKEIIDELIAGVSHGRPSPETPINPPRGEGTWYGPERPSRTSEAEEQRVISWALHQVWDQKAQVEVMVAVDNATMLELDREMIKGNLPFTFVESIRQKRNEAARQAIENARSRRQERNDYPTRTLEKLGFLLTREQALEKLGVHDPARPGDVMCPTCGKGYATDIGAAMHWYHTDHQFGPEMKERLIGALETRAKERRDTTPGDKRSP